ncbi:type II secretion system protein J [Bacteriovorax sp. Seq25_V]|uniref:PulJ/GspJ family protein n=1 Tax=Bacteriovorax sp. Seq25_V TaxID=1201288 RepID=UPI00038A10B5|nr:prepilin-type N-terminal cleavage/methylation domain-containing protein [Bacteriovorax sp. Seq25_V]EQC46058.1 type II secretion system protein J [Bacteriovorax sp. Seq25_V]
MKSPKINNQAGFTLLEVLIAITILSLLMVSIYSVIENSTTTKDKIIAEDRDKMQLEMALARIETDLVYIYSPLYYESTQKEDTALYTKAFKKAPPGQDQSEDDQNSVYDEKKSRYDSLEQYVGLSESGNPVPKVVSDDTKSLVFFSSAGRRLIRDSKQSKFTWIKYSVENAKDPVNKDAPLVLMRSTITENIFNDELEWDKVKAQPLLENIKELKFSFYDEKREKYVDTIKELTVSPQTPRLIKITLAYQSESGEVYEGERTFRPIWPKVDTRKALEEKYKFQNNGPTGGQVGGNGDSSGGIIGGSGDGDDE